MADIELNRNKDFSTEFSRFVKALVYLCTLLVLGFFIFLVLALMRISSCAFYTYDSYQDIPPHQVGLLLGTSSHIGPGQPNEYFTNRIMAAANLYKKGKIQYILVSGDNRHESYNEPRMMMNALLHEGVSLNHIVADFAGFSTLDSVLRARHVFMLRDMIIISQDFHNERAIFIARANDIEAIGFNAANPQSSLAHFKVSVREFFARLKCVFEVYFIDAMPTYLGEPISIGNAPLPKQPTDKPKHPTSKPKLPGFSAAGLKLQELEELKRTAKQPTDSALILRQEELARSQFQRTLLHENVQTQPGELAAPMIPMSSPIEQKAELNELQQGEHLPRLRALEDMPPDETETAETTGNDTTDETQEAAPVPSSQPAKHQAPPAPQRHLFGDPWE